MVWVAHSQVVLASGLQSTSTVAVAMRAARVPCVECFKNEEKRIKGIYSYFKELKVGGMKELGSQYLAKRLQFELVPCILLS